MSDKEKEVFYGGEDLLDLVAQEEAEKARKAAAVEFYGSEVPLLKEGEGLASLADQEEAKKAVGEEVKEPAQGENSRSNEEDVRAWLEALREDREDLEDLYGGRK